MEAESIEKLHKLDDHLGTASAGHVADARQLIDLARRQSQGNRLRYGEPVGVDADEVRHRPHSGEHPARRHPAVRRRATHRRHRQRRAASVRRRPLWDPQRVEGDRHRRRPLRHPGPPRRELDRGVSLDAGVELAIAARAAHDDEFEPTDLAVATVTEADGYRTVPVEEVTEAFEAAGLTVEEDDEGDEEEGADADADDEATDADNEE